MKPENFFYWLQGYFELSDKYQLSSSQVGCILRHIDLVRNTPGNEKLPERIVQIETLLSVFDSLDAIETTNKIQEWIHAEFFHVIDPSLGPKEVQTKLRKIHSPHPDKILITC